jgi:hypothetical protein
VTTQPGTAAGQQLTQQTIGPSDLAILNLAAFPNPDGSILLQAVFQNVGQYPTYNEFYSHVYLDHMPSGPGDLTGAASFWINAPIAPSEIVTLTTVLTDGTLSGLRNTTLASSAPVPATDHPYSFSGQIDSTGSVNDSGRENNIISDVQACTTTADAYEPDNDIAQASTLAVGTSQLHNIHTENDVDWVSFVAQAGKKYRLYTYDLAASADTYLYLYGNDATTLLASNDDHDETLASNIEWTAPSSGTYYLLIHQWNPYAHGCAQQYTLTVSMLDDNTPTATSTSTSTSTASQTVTTISTSTISTTPSSSATAVTTALVPTATGTPTPATAIPTTATPTACLIQFTDVPTTNSFYPYIRCLACRAVLGGYTTNERCAETGAPCFRPGDNITRGQMAKVVSNAAAFSEPHDDVTFADVPTTHTFYIFIQRLASRNVISGYNDPARCLNGVAPCFLPDALVTRGQMSKFVALAAEFDEPVSPTTQSFTDVPTTDTFWAYIERLSGRGVVGGYACGAENEECDGQNRPYFRPTANVTRGQASKFVSLAFFPNCETPARK